MIIFTLQRNSRQEVAEQVFSYFDQLELLPNTSGNEVFLVTAITTDDWPYIWVLTEMKSFSGIPETAIEFIDEHVIRCLNKIMNNHPPAQEYSVTVIQYDPKKQQKQDAHPLRPVVH